MTSAPHLLIIRDVRRVSHSLSEWSSAPLRATVDSRRGRLDRVDSQPTPTALASWETDGGRVPEQTRRRTP